MRSHCAPPLPLSTGDRPTPPRSAMRYLWAADRQDWPNIKSNDFDGWNVRVVVVEGVTRAREWGKWSTQAPAERPSLSAASPGTCTPGRTNPLGRPHAVPSSLRYAPLSSILSLLISFINRSLDLYPYT